MQHNDRWISISIIIGMLSIFMSCSSSKDVMESNLNRTPAVIISDRDIPLSTLAFEYKINKAGLNTYVSNYLDSICQSPWNYPEEHVEAFLSRTTLCTIECQDQRLLINLPLQIDLDKTSFLGKWSAYGEILLTIVTDIDISANWDIRTHTEIVDYQWLRTPKMTIGFMDIPIQSIADNISNRIKPIIEESIDAAVRDNFDLQQQALNLLSPILKPYQLDQSVGGWISMSADSIHFSPWTNQEEYVSGKIYASFKTTVTSRPAPTGIIELPPFTWNNAIGTISTFKIHTDLAYQYLTELARSNFVNKIFKSGNRIVKLEDLSIYGGSNRIGIKMKTSGSFNGTIQIEGKPYYHLGMLRASDLKWSVQTNNLLHKAAAWIKKGFIHDQLEQTLVFDLNDYINTAQSELYTVLADVKSQKAIEFNLRWGSSEIQNLVCNYEGLNFLMMLNVQIETIIDEVPSGY